MSRWMVLFRREGSQTWREWSGSWGSVSEAQAELIDRGKSDDSCERMIVPVTAERERADDVVDAAESLVRFAGEHARFGLGTELEALREAVRVFKTGAPVKRGVMMKRVTPPKMIAASGGGSGSAHPPGESDRELLVRANGVIAAMKKAGDAMADAMRHVSLGGGGCCPTTGKPHARPDDEWRRLRSEEAKP